MENVKMSKIPHFRDVVRSVKMAATFAGISEDGTPMYDNNKPMPTVSFRGTVKIHGTNGSVCLHKGKVYAQSKNRVLTVEKDNYGFALFVEKNKHRFLDILTNIADFNEVDTDRNVLTLFGEFAGKGIQKGVGISNIDKSFFTFGCKVTNTEGDKHSIWLDTEDFSAYLENSEGIYDLNEFAVYYVNVDFSSPISLGKSQKIFEELTYEVEEECPIAKVFGHSGIGEGIVWTTKYKGQTYTFKTKGDKHSVTKVTKVAEIDIEKLESVEAFVEYSSTDNRFKQALGEVFKDETPSINKMGDLIRWVVTDIISEETDTLIENGLEPKDVNKYISQDVRQRFLGELNKM